MGAYVGSRMYLKGAGSARQDLCSVLGARTGGQGAGETIKMKSLQRLERYFGVEGGERA